AAPPEAAPVEIPEPAAATPVTTQEAGSAQVDSIAPGESAPATTSSPSPAISGETPAPPKPVVPPVPPAPPKPQVGEKVGFIVLPQRPGSQRPGDRDRGGSAPPRPPQNGNRPGQPSAGGQRNDQRGGYQRGGRDNPSPVT